MTTMCSEKASAMLIHEVVTSKPIEIQMITAFPIDCEMLSYPFEINLEDETWTQLAPFKRVVGQEVYMAIYQAGEMYLIIVKGVPLNVESNQGIGRKV